MSALRRAQSSAPDSGSTSRSRSHFHSQASSAPRNGPSSSTSSSSSVSSRLLALDPTPLQRDLMQLQRRFAGNSARVDRDEAASPVDDVEFALQAEADMANSFPSRVGSDPQDAGDPDHDEREEKKEAEDDTDDRNPGRGGGRDGDGGGGDDGNGDDDAQDPDEDDNVEARPVALPIPFEGFEAHQKFCFACEHDIDHRDPTSNAHLPLLQQTLQHGSGVDWNRVCRSVVYQYNKHFRPFLTDKQRRKYKSDSLPEWTLASVAGHLMMKNAGCRMDYLRHLQFAKLQLIVQSGLAIYDRNKKQTFLNKNGSKVLDDTTKQILILERLK